MSAPTPQHRASPLSTASSAIALPSELRPSSRERLATVFTRRLHRTEPSLGVEAAGSGRQGAWAFPTVCQAHLMACHILMPCSRGLCRLGEDWLVSWDNDWVTTASETLIKMLRDFAVAVRKVCRDELITMSYCFPNRCGWRWLWIFGRRTTKV